VTTETISMEAHRKIVDDIYAELRQAVSQRFKPQRLSDDQIARVWFDARIPGLTETDARRLIRAAERVYMETPS
jgi:hypothetical protein